MSHNNKSFSVPNIQALLEKQPEAEFSLEVKSYGLKGGYLFQVGDNNQGHSWMLYDVNGRQHETPSFLNGLTRVEIFEFFKEIDRVHLAGQIDGENIARWSVKSWLTGDLSLLNSK